MLKPIFTLKDHLQETHIFNSRIWVAIGFIILLTALMLARLVYLQVYQHGKYTTLSQKNRLSLKVIEPKRGLIYDRNGTVVAENIPVFNLEITPEYITDMQAVVEKIQQLIQLSDDERELFFERYKQTPAYGKVTVKVQLSEDDVAKIMVNQYDLPGVEINARLVRQYPLGPVMAPVLGYVARINAQELSNLTSGNYRADDYIGKMGIEQSYESTLRGKTGYHQVESDAKGRVMRTVNTTPPVAGHNLHLTIDSRLQQAAYDAFKNQPGAAVAIDPRNGEVLALVSNPSFDPNIFIKGISQQNFQALQQSSTLSMFNRALRGRYPTASTIKAFIAIASLNHAAIPNNFRIRDPGYFKLPGSQHVFRNWLRSGHGIVDLYKAIVVSNDTFFYHIAYQLGIKELATILAAFGFGEKTGIDVFEESAGILPTPRWKQKTLGKKWFAGDTINTGIGQGYTVSTPIQLANATATLAQRGQRYQPFLVKTLGNLDNIIYQQQPKLVQSIPFSKSSWQQVVTAMQDVIIMREGTGFRFGRETPYSVAAKTGTAQVYSLKGEKALSYHDTPENLRDHSLFIMFSPVEQPTIALAVIVEHSNQAPVVARKIMEQYWQGLSS
jgi:penicillin-binding protein 2